MDEAVMEVMLVGGEGLWQEAANKALVASVGGIAVWAIQRWWNERQSKGNKVEKMHKTLFGMEGVDAMEGIVEIMEAHERDIEQLYEEIQEERERRKEMGRRVENLIEKVKGRQNGEKNQ